MPHPIALQFETSVKIPIDHVELSVKPIKSGKVESLALFALIKQDCEEYVDKALYLVTNGYPFDINHSSVGSFYGTFNVNGVDVHLFERVIIRV